MNIYKNCNLKKYSYIKQEMNIFNVVEVFNEKELISAYLSNENVVIGNCSKSLFIDEEMHKMVIVDKNEYIKEDDKTITLGSGCKLFKIGKYFENKGLDGFSKIRTIPGTIGGSLYNNASCFNQSISDYLISVKVYVDHKIVNLKKEELKFSYRDSLFKNNKLLILNAKFKKVSKNKNTLIQEYQESINLRKKYQSFNYLSFGSTFINHKYYKAKELLKNYEYEDEHIKVDKKNPNFILIKNGFSYFDILKQIHMQKRYVYLKYKILLRPEIGFIY